jgi:hypothetical protein
MIMDLVMNFLISATDLDTISRLKIHIVSHNMSPALNSTSARSTASSFDGTFLETNHSAMICKGSGDILDSDCLT